MTYYRTSQIARRVGIHSNTVRQYEASGLLPPIARSAKSYRQFTLYDLEHVILIRLAFKFTWLGGSIRNAALDNASGVATLLALAQTLEPDAMPFGLELVFFGGEDSWYPVDAAYFTAYDFQAHEVILAINVDGVGLKGHAPSICYMSFPDRQTGHITSDLAAPAGIVEVEPWPQSDHSFFAALGIPSIAISSDNAWGQLGTLVHTPNDTADKIDMGSIARTVDFIAALLSDLADQGQSIREKFQGRTVR